MYSYSCSLVTSNNTFLSPGNAMDPHLMFHHAASNVICQVLFARRFDYEDEFMTFFVDLFHQTSKIINGRWGMVSDILLPETLSQVPDQPYWSCTFRYWKFG